MSDHEVSAPAPPPAEIEEHASKAVDYVHRAVGMILEYDSDTLPILDHYLRDAGAGPAAAAELVACTAGAYFGEVVRRRLGGNWQLPTTDPASWRLVLPGGLSFSPAGMALAAIYLSDEVEIDTSLRAPAPLEPHLEDALERMGAVSEAEYFSLCGRLDTLEHLQAVLLAVAAREAERRHLAN